MPVDYEATGALLADRFSAVTVAALAGDGPSPALVLDKDVERIFASGTQAFREVLIGCVLARWCDRNINLTKPYVKQGSDAFNGRTLDERVVNPFFQEHRIPCTRGPYLSVFRRSLRFVAATRDGLRDKEGYDALLRLIRHIAAAESTDEILEFLDRLLFSFYMLREAAQVPIARLQRISLEHISVLMRQLLSVSSGGRFPMYLVESTLVAIKTRFDLDWDITVQGINVADAPGGMVGDIEVVENGETVFAAEVTERRIDADRVIAIFETKIAPNTIKDYLFLTSDEVEEAAKEQARVYFALGHEVNFIDISDWIWHTLASIGSAGRAEFLSALQGRLGSDDTPTAVKTVWNQEVARLTRAV